MLAHNLLPKALHKYGVLKINKSSAYPLQIDGIVEKPAAGEGPSSWSVAGRYIFPPDVMKALETQGPGAGGETQLTDATARCISAGLFVGLPFIGKRFDCGNKRGFLVTIMYFNLKPGSL